MSQEGIIMSKKRIIMYAAGACINIISENNTNVPMQTS